MNLEKNPDSPKWEKAVLDENDIREAVKLWLATQGHAAYEVEFKMGYSASGVGFGKEEWEELKAACKLIQP
jgi:hypothetical protein